MSTPKCPSCNKECNVRVVDGQRAVCKSCSKVKRCVFQFCWACQREWPKDASTTNSCMLPNCALRAALLSDVKISEPHSSVRGCPYFRACPNCKALLTHSGIGCPKITCPHCKTNFCFRCLNRWCIGIVDIEAHRSLFRRLFLYQDHDISIDVCRQVDNKQSLIVLGL